MICLYLCIYSDKLFPPILLQLYEQPGDCLSLPHLCYREKGRKEVFLLTLLCCRGQKNCYCLAQLGGAGTEMRCLFFPFYHFTMQPFCWVVVVVKGQNPTGDHLIVCIYKFVWQVLEQLDTIQTYPSLAHELILVAVTLGYLI